MRYSHFKPVIFCLVVLLTIAKSNVVAQLVYSTTLDNTGFTTDNDRVNGASLTNDGGVIAAGQILNNASGKSWGPGIVTKLDANGTPAWWLGLESYHPDSATFSGNDIRFYDAIQDASGDYVVSGEFRHSYRQMSDGILLKVNPNGKIKWFKRYNINKDHRPAMIIGDLAQLPNGSYVGTGLTGYGYSKGGWLWFQSDVNGENVVVKSFGHSKRAAGVKLLPQADNSSVIAWFTGTNGSDGDIYPVFSRVDASGNLLSEKWVVLDYNAILTDCIQTSDGGFAAIGCGISESFLLKLDANLDVQWIKSWPIGSATGGFLISETFSSVTELSSGNFYITGAYYPTLNNSLYENLAVVTDANGNLIAAKSISQSASTQEKIQKTLELPDGRIMSLGNVITSSTASDISVFHDNAAGVTACTSVALNFLPTSNGVLFDKDKPLVSPSVFPIVIIKDTLTISTSFSQSTICPPLDLGLTVVNSDFKIYPNPVSESISFQFPDDRLEEEFEVSIMKLDGRLMVKTILSESSRTINMSNWPAGMYSWQLHGNNGSHESGFFVKQ